VSSASAFPDTADCHGYFVHVHRVTSVDGSVVLQNSRSVVSSIRLLAYRLLSVLLPLSSHWLCIRSARFGSGKETRRGKQCRFLVSVPRR